MLPMLPGLSLLKVNSQALQNNISTYSDTSILTGDKVYYKRFDTRCWRDPAIVLGKDRQQVLLKHGGYYIRVHPYQLRLVREFISPVGSSAGDPTRKTATSESDQSHLNAALPTLPPPPSDSELDNKHEAAIGPLSPPLSPRPPHTPRPNGMCHSPVTRSRLRLALSPSPVVLSWPSSSTPECPQCFSALNPA